MPITAEIKLDEKEIIAACMAHLEANGWKTRGVGTISIKRGWTDQREGITTPDSAEFVAKVEQRK